MSEIEFTQEDDARLAEVLGLGRAKKLKMRAAIGEVEVWRILKDNGEWIVPKPYLTDPTLATDAEIKAFVGRKISPAIKHYFKCYEQVVEVPEWVDIFHAPKEYMILWEKPGDAARALKMAIDQHGRHFFRVGLEQVR